MPRGELSPVVAKLPRSSPLGANSRIVLPFWLATNRFCVCAGENGFCARADAMARLSAARRLSTRKARLILRNVRIWTDMSVSFRVLPRYVRRPKGRARDLRGRADTAETRENWAAFIVSFLFGKVVPIRKDHANGCPLLR